MAKITYTDKVALEEEASIWKKVKKVYIKKNGTWYINKND
jgi:hypothetical protein